MHAHSFTGAFREGSDGAFGTCHHFRAHGVLITAAGSVPGAGHPGSCCFWLPPNKSSMQSEVPRLPLLEKPQGSTSLNQPTAPGQGKTESDKISHVPDGRRDTTHSSVPICGASRVLQLVHTECTRHAPHRGRKREGVGLRPPARGEKAPLNQKRLWLCSCPAQAGRAKPGGVGAIPMLHNKKGF